LLSDQQAACPICQRIAEIENYPGFVAELETGYVLLTSRQFFKGSAFLYSRPHATELHQLEPDFRANYLVEMSLVAEAIFKAFGPRKMNYLLQGNTVPHLHWSLIPRYADDPLPTGPIYDIDRAIWASEEAIPSAEERERIRTRLLNALEGLASTHIQNSFKR